MKTCGTCTLCCSLVSVGELQKPSFTPCRFQRSIIHAAGPGCAIYRDRPHSCKQWSCVWLTAPDNIGEEYRPDRVGFVVDPTLDLVKVNGVEKPAAQFWVAPGHEDDWRTSAAASQYIATVLDITPVILWRMPPGTHCRAFTKVDGEFVYTEPTHYLPDMLGGERERQRRVQEILAES